MRRSQVKAAVCCGLQIPPELYDKVKTMANEHQCSVNAMIKGILEETVRAREAWIAHTERTVAELNAKQNSKR